MNNNIKLTEQEKEHNKKEAWNKLILIVMERLEGRKENKCSKTAI